MGCCCGCSAQVMDGSDMKIGTLWMPYSHAELWKLITDLKTSPSKSITDFAESVSCWCRRLRSVAGLRKALHRYPDGQRDPESYFVEHTLPVIVDHAIALKERAMAAFPEGIPLLRVGHRASVRLPRGLVASLVAHMFLCSWEAPVAVNYRIMPPNSFLKLLDGTSQAEVAKLRMFIHYFERLGKDGELRGFIIIDRVYGVGLEQDGWQSSNKPLLPMNIAGQGKGFEEAPGLAHADFANMFLGGGVLSNGSIQEEIRFTICPELLSAMLLCPRMDEDEAIQIVGAQQYSAYGGYGRNLAYAGDFKDTVYPRDADGTPLISILAMDAFDFKRRDSSLKAQMSPYFALRELNKALAAFTPVDEVSLRNFPSIATGNWGCGAFKGNAPLKALLQWCAASQAGRQLRYFPFEMDWGPLLLEISNHLVAQGATVGELMTAFWLVRERLHTFKRENIFQAVDMTIAIGAAKDKGTDPSPTEATK
mmetsp:Transcript_7904/g.14742  ORF Transcript_7904/g.14742 Transcript_7904/m.14742 type:complete len:479 (+) Transcript_7904:9-1445(+)